MGDLSCLWSGSLLVLVSPVSVTSYCEWGAKANFPLPGERVGERGETPPRTFRKDIPCSRFPLRSRPRWLRG